MTTSSRKEDILANRGRVYRSERVFVRLVGLKERRVGVFPDVTVSTLHEHLVPPLGEFDIVAGVVLDDPVIDIRVVQCAEDVARSAREIGALRQQLLDLDRAGVRSMAAKIREEMPVRGQGPGGFESCPLLIGNGNHFRIEKGERLTHFDGECGNPVHATGRFAEGDVSSLRGSAWQSEEMHHRSRRERISSSACRNRSGPSASLILM